METKSESQKILPSIFLLLAALLLRPRSVRALDYAIGADLSFLKQAEDRDVLFKDFNEIKPGLQIFKNHGYNWIRLRLFHTPTRLPNNLEYTIALAKDAKKLGFKFLLNYHYSDTWADPGKQYIPRAWEGKSHDELVNAVFEYTRDTIVAFRDAGVMPEMVQPGNEIINGMLWPDGKLPDHWDNFAELMKAGIDGVDEGRGNADRPLIMIHIDQGGNKKKTKAFFDKWNSYDIDYDIIGQSYYPWWHGSLLDLRENLIFMANEYKKDIILVEVAYNCEPAVNAIRTSHNPPAPELLDLCDRMGFVVWDEAFDKWDDKADRVRGKPPLEQYGEKQIRNLVMRDRNHPCVVIWSIGNEIGNRPYDREGKSPERVKFMRDSVRKYDSTRPVGISCHIPGTVDEPILDSLDLTGWNYARRYARYRERYPEKPIIYSESASALSTRGFYELPFPNEKTQFSKQFQVGSYDLNSAAWSDIPDVEFQLMEDDGFVAGEFVWTGFDYLGEPTPFARQARSSYFGIVDLCGIPKDRQ